MPNAMRGCEQERQNVLPERLHERQSQFDQPHEAEQGAQASSLKLFRSLLARFGAAVAAASHENEYPGIGLPGQLVELAELQKTA